jgi:molybdopterin-guanine dinucleotide biosynthesis protein B
MSRPVAARAPFVVLVVSRASGAGKTTLVTRLVPALTALGLRVAAVKLSHHDIEFDVAGKDSRRIRDAGAEPVALVGPGRLTIFAPTPHAPSTGPDARRGATALRAIVAALTALSSPDVVVVEGGRDIPDLHRIEVVPPGGAIPAVPSARAARYLVAVARDGSGRGATKGTALRGVAVLRRDDAAGLAALVAARASAETRAARATSARPARRPSRARTS